MWRTDNSRVVSSWTNGRMANVYLVEEESGRRVIRKRYKRRFLLAMVREYLATVYLTHWLDITPRVLSFGLISGELVLSHMPGVRVLEWVLARYGDPDLRIEDFQSFHGLDTNATVAEAFRRFRDCRSPEAVRLKQAISRSYAALHRTWFVHGGADPRNIIYDGERVFIIDFNQSRPSLNPQQFERACLCRWYGISSEEMHQSNEAAMCL